MAPSTLLTAAFFLLMGLGAIWVGWYLPHVNRGAPSGDAPATALSSPRGRLLWRIVCTMAGLGFVGFGVTTLRYTQGRYVSVPATAPLIDQAIWTLTFICMGGSWVMGVVCLLVYQARQNQQRYIRELADESRDSDSDQ
jgi:hypothetical protein